MVAVNSHSLTEMQTLRLMKFTTMFEALYFCVISMENCQNSHVTKDADKHKEVSQGLIQIHSTQGWKWE